MKKMNFHSGNAARKLALFGTTVLLAALVNMQANAQTTPQTNPQPARAPAAHAKPHRRHASKAKAVAPVPVVPQQPPPPQVLQSLFDKPPQPASVTLANNTLTIHADNSSLTAILQQVASSSGMRFEGLAQDQRIFGTYGPGDPHSVLNSLLDGSGYNVMMLGQTSAGAPRQLTLSPRNNMPAMQMPRPVAPVSQNDDDATEDDAQPQQPPDNPPPAPERPTPNATRTPQQLMQELQQMRQQQQQQQSQQEQQQMPPQETPPQ